ncbi:copper amine oxidase N-terminal domain-containing protein [Pseudobacteroides cellulosolvens]|uniref:Copper amine oxidase-like domain-containing protein n=1 Tax=Pseudobacteroides cellulosolvens ATCC 35603 = DSM 2933 TaxID=398512 RepID=A0A0L6JQD4_9FIRM|nr:copper amine oxidase N-terminal domain-containing protein [Pseudobacteroides cellulosolvens]KNY27900.1 copper amine oxidase-like domain-containing protein [Pseudobacteroides cellulosolvens ATCC 35603 = DSM 2933]
MKRRAVLLCLVILIIITGSLYSNATQIILKVNYPKMVLDNDEIDIGYYEKVVPVIVNNRTMVPIRSIVEVLGGVVNWDDSDEKISIEYNDRKIEMRVNDNNITVDGEDKYSDVPPMIVDDWTMVPLRFISENFGLLINWDSKNKKITIKTNQQDFEKYKGQISFWHYNVEELTGMVKAFNKVYPNITVNLTVNTLKNMEYQNKLTAAVRAGSQVPDIFASEGTFVKRFVDDNDFYMDISDRARELSGNMVTYTVDLEQTIEEKLRPYQIKFQ